MAHILSKRHEIIFFFYSIPSRSPLPPLVRPIVEGPVVVKFYKNDTLRIHFDVRFVIYFKTDHCFGKGREWERKRENRFCTRRKMGGGKVGKVSMKIVRLERSETFSTKDEFDIFLRSESICVFGFLQLQFFRMLNFKSTFIAAKNTLFCERFFETFKKCIIILIIKK